LPKISAANREQSIAHAAALISGPVKRDNRPGYKDLILQSLAGDSDRRRRFADILSTRRRHRPSQRRQVLQFVHRAMNVANA